MRPLTASALLAATVFAAGCAHDVPTAPGAMLTAEIAAVAAQSGASCENIRGTIEGNAFVPGGVTYEGLGTGSATILGLDPKGAHGQGAILLVTMHQITTSQGTITTSDEGVLAPIDPPVYRLNSRYTITGGTDGFEGASGFMHLNATVSLATGGLTGFYHGRVCT